MDRLIGVSADDLRLRPGCHLVGLHRAGTRPPPFRVMNHYVKYYTELKTLSKVKAARALASKPKKKAQSSPILPTPPSVRKAKRAAPARNAQAPHDDKEFQQIREFEQEADRLIDSADQ